MEKRVLVVDDDRLILEMTRDALAPEGFEVAMASSGPEALRLLEGWGGVDLVITDLFMPEMDGIELLDRVRRGFPRLDVIVLTAYASLESALRAMRLGAADYIRKPVKPAEILYCVKRTLLRRRLAAENQSLRSRVQTWEAARVLCACLETNDIMPFTLDIAQRLLGRSRAIGRWIHMNARPGDGTFIMGFSTAETQEIRDQIERGKLFDPVQLDGMDSRGSSSLQEGLALLDLEDEHLLAIPLRGDGRIVGGIWLFSEGRAFDEDERRCADLVAAQAELAFHNAERFLHAREKAFVDDVTDLYNARYLLAALDREIHRAERGALEISVLFLDLDRFKNVNDNHGHLVGSRVLREFGQLLQGSVRAIDTVARYGGDEFCVILVDTGPGGARAVAERVRRATERRHFGADNGLSLEVTVSIGISIFPHHGCTRESLLDQSDKAMYLGKSLGRNRVCAADDLGTHGDVPL